LPVRKGNPFFIMPGSYHARQTVSVLRSFLSRIEVEFCDMI